MATQNFPINDKACILTTFKTTAYTRQELVSTSSDVYVRVGVDNVWGAWGKLSGGMVSKAKAQATSAVLAFGSIPPQSTVTRNVTISGIEFGNFAVVNPKVALQEGLTFSAWVSATDTLSIRLANSTTADITPTGNWDYLII